MQHYKYVEVIWRKDGSSYFYYSDDEPSPVPTWWDIPGTHLFLSWNMTFRKIIKAYRRK